MKKAKEILQQHKPLSLSKDIINKLRNLAQKAENNLLNFKFSA